MSAQSQRLQASSKKDAASADRRPQAPDNPTPKSNASKSKNPPKNSKQNTPSDEERRKESSKLSQYAQTAKKKAQELRQAADEAADPDQRRRLMEEATNKQREAESLAKTAKYLQSGTFQGLAVGTGIGTAPGLALGTVTGTLVGGTVSLVTGAAGGILGAATGAATGAIHGPFWDVDKLAEKAGLSKMAGLNPQAQNDGKAQSWMQQGASILPFTPATNPKEGDENADPSADIKQNDVLPKSGGGVLQNKTMASSPSESQVAGQDLSKLSTKSSSAQFGQPPSNQINASRNRTGKAPRKLEIRKKDSQ